MKQKPPHRPSRAGFTLVELLVVMGIILVLIGILVPLVGKVKRAAYQADTANEISQIASACEKYYTDFGAYPGPVSNDDIENQYVSTKNPTALPVNIRNSSDSAVLADPTMGVYFTASENLVLGLMGGLTVNAATGDVLCKPNPVSYVTPGLVGGGPLTLNIQSPGGQPAYLASNFNLSTNYSSGHYLYQGATAAKDCVIPVFVDRYSDPMPILYVRARKGARGVVSDGIYVDSRTSNPAHYQYDVREFYAYTTTSIGTAPNGHGLQGIDTTPLPYVYQATLPNSVNAPSTWTKNATSYLCNPGVQPPPNQDANDYGVPQKADGFILISAGPDRTYGTVDDQTNFGSVR